MFEILLPCRGISYLPSSTSRHIPRVSHLSHRHNHVHRHKHKPHQYISFCRNEIESNDRRRVGKLSRYPRHFHPHNRFHHRICKYLSFKERKQYTRNKSLRISFVNALGIFSTLKLIWATMRRRLPIWNVLASVVFECTTISTLADIPIRHEQTEILARVWFITGMLITGLLIPIEDFQSKTLRILL